MIYDTILFIYDLPTKISWDQQTVPTATVARYYFE